MNEHQRYRIIYLSKDRQEEDFDRRVDRVIVDDTILSRELKLWSSPARLLCTMVDATLDTIWKERVSAQARAQKY